jgi:Apolipoprotein A1/A4/E domain
MAQEQAKSPPVGAETGTKTDTSASPNTGKDTGENAEFELEPDGAAEVERKLSLAERLRVEQRKISERKSPEPKMDERKPAEPDEALGAGSRPITRSRRPAGPPPRRIAAAAAANDDVPSIGGLIFALQQKPSKSPFVVALFASVLWFMIGGFFAYGTMSAQENVSDTAGLLASPAALPAAVGILVPIAIFWFLALLVWRAQELRLMASAMTEVAVRLAEPDKLAEQSVASLGQTIRRQVAAMNDAISRAIGRAGELEALVHNEVAALERSYSDNELRVRGLISELASEREALANNSERVSESLRGVGAQIARDLTAASSSIDKRLADRGTQLTELLVARSSEAAARVEQAQNRVQEQMPVLLERLGQEQERLSQVIEGAAQNLSALETAVGARTTALDNTLKERTEALTTTLASRINALETTVGHGAILLDKTLKERTEQFVASVGQSAVGLDQALKQRTEAFATSIGQGAAGLDNLLKERARLLAASISEQSDALDKTLRERTETFITSVGHGAIGLDKLLKDRTEAFVLSIGQGAVGLDKLLQERTEAFARSVGQGAIGLDSVLKEHTKLLTSTLIEESATLDKTLKQHTETLTNAVEQGVSGIDKTLKERTETFTNSVEQGVSGLDRMMQQRAEQMAAFLGQGAAVLDQTLKERTELLATSIGQGATALDKTLKDHSENFHKAITHQATNLAQSLEDRTNAFTSAINQGAIALDRTLAERSDAFTNSIAQRTRAVEFAIGQQAAAMDQSLADRTHAVTTSLAERLKSIDTTFGQRASEVDRMLAEHARAVEATFGRQAAQLNELLANNNNIIRQTASEVGAQSKDAIGVLTAQTQTLREVSRGLLDQIHSLTQRFENQGEAILSAARALDSSNAKIDSILESRHQAIIGLLHAVNTKGEDLDNVMRSYAGTIENALTQVESRAKQVGTALARDTTGQAQQALSQIERLREEAQAHTARAVGDLKSSFETVITQIGRQLEQMRGQFDNASKGMRDAAQKTASDLDSLRQEMLRRMEGLPQQTAQATAAIRKALADQLKEIEAITPVLTRPQLASSATEQQPYRQPQLPTRRGPLPPSSDENHPEAAYEAPPAPQFDPRGRPIGTTPEPSAELGSVAGNLAQQLAGASHPEQRRAAQRPGLQGQRPYPPAAGEDHSREGWSVSELITNAEAPTYDAPKRRPDPYAARGGYAPQPQGAAQSLRLDEIARALDHRTAAEVWQRFRAGERGVLGRHLYSLDGQATFDEISRRYDRDPEFRATVDRYIGDFERLLQEAEQNDPDGRMLQNYMTSETGRVYLLLAHASGRLR